MRRVRALVAVLAAIVGCAASAAEAAEPETGRIVIVPRLAERRIKTDAPVPAEVTLTTRDPNVQRTLRTRLVNAAIVLDDMELDAFTGVRRVAIDLERSNPIGMAGDQVGTFKDSWLLRRDGGRLRGAVHVEQLMRLVHPEDTRLGVARATQDPPPAFHSPVRFAWDRVPGAPSYRVDVIIRGRPTRPAQMPIDTAETSVAIELLPTAPGEFYTLALQAFGEGTRLGALTIDGMDMRHSPYRFRVVPPEERADVPKPPSRSVVADVFGGTARLALVPTLDGERWELPPRSWARIGLFSETAMKQLDIRLVDGVAELGDLAAGTYTPSITIDASDAESPGPHSECRAYHGDHPVELRLANGATTRHEAPFRCAIRLRRPAIPEKPPKEPVEIPSPVTFEWSPVPHAVRYAYEVEGSTPRGPMTVARGEGEGTTWTTEIGPSLLPGDSYRLNVTAHGRSGELGRLDAVSKFRVPGGTPEPGVGRITLVPMFDGRAFDATVDLPVRVNLMRVPGGDARDIPARLAKGVIELEGIDTGIYGVSLMLHTSDAPEMFPASANRPVAVLHDGAAVRHELLMYAPLEFVTGPPMLEAPRVARPMLTSPVTIEWKPVHGATRYRVNLDDGAAVDDEESQVRTFMVTKPSWTGELPPTGPEEYYTVIVEAEGERARVGEWIFHFGVEGGGRPSR